MTEPTEDLDVKVAAWRLVTQENLPQREVARRLGISQASVSRYVAEGRNAETYVLAFAKAELRKDVGYILREQIRHWMGRLFGEGQEPLELKDGLAVSDHLAKLLGQFAQLMGLNEPTRVAVGQDTGEPRVPDARMVAAIEAAQRDNEEILARVRAGLPPWPTREESA